MGELFVSLGLGAWKPLLATLALPPVPFLVLVAAGAWRRGRGAGGWLVAFGIAGVWLSACTGSGRWIVQALLQPPPALDAARIAALAAQARGAATPAPAVVVLGGGREAFAPEYGMPDLRPHTLARLRYGLWLGRRIDAPVGVSGGTGWAQPDGPPEAQIAARIAAAEFGQPLAWTEAASRDTRANATGTVALLRRAGVGHAVLVTHAWHMPRALRRFEAAAGGSMRFTPAPIGLGTNDSPVYDWLPTAQGTELVRVSLRELMARALGD